MSWFVLLRRDQSSCPFPPRSGLSDPSETRSRALTFCSVRLGRSCDVVPPTPGACGKTQGFALSPVRTELTRERPCYLGAGSWGKLLLKSACWLRSQHLESASQALSPSPEPVEGCILGHLGVGAVLRKAQLTLTCQTCRPSPSPLWNLPAGVCLHSWDGVEDGWGGAALWVLRLWPNILRPTGASPG